MKGGPSTASAATRKSASSGAPTRAEVSPSRAALPDLQRAVGNKAIADLFQEGQPLDPTTRHFMENRFRRDFSGVRVHTNRQAGEAALAASSVAFTEGHDIVFSPGSYGPDTGVGRRLLAHELAHVVQQSCASATGQSSGRAELEAEFAGRAATARDGAPPVSSRMRVGIQKQDKPEKEPPKPGTGAYIAWMGVSMVKSDKTTHWTSEQQRRRTIWEYIQYAKTDPKLKGLYDEAVAAYPDIVSAGPPSTAPDKSSPGADRVTDPDMKTPAAQKPPPAAPETKLIDDFGAKFGDAAKLIKANPKAMDLIKEAANAGAKFGGYAEEGPAKDTWPYTVGDSVFIPRARTDAVEAVQAFLFELNNAIRAPKFAQLLKDAAKGKKDKQSAKEYAHHVIEQEVEGLLRLGEVWFDMKKSQGKNTKAWDKYDEQFFLPLYKAFKDGTKTKEQIINEVSARKYTTGVDAGKTVEQFYMEQYDKISGGK